MENEPLVSLTFESEDQFQAWFRTIASRHGYWIKRNRNANKANARTVEGFSKEAINACILPKETVNFVCDHAGSYVQKKSQVVESTSVGTSSSSDITILKKRRVQKRHQSK